MLTWAPETEHITGVLMEFEEFFDRILSNWDTELITFKLKEGMKPYQGKVFPIPKYMQAP